MFTWYDISIHDLMTTISLNLLWQGWYL